MTTSGGAYAVASEGAAATGNGGSPFKTGVFPDMPRIEYDAIRALSNSGMKHLAVSSLRYWWQTIAPVEREEAADETKAKRMGSALHVAVLETPEVFDQRYACELDPSNWPVCLDTIGDIRTWISEHWNPAWGKEPKGSLKADVIGHALALMKRLQIEVPILDEEKRRHFAQNENKVILTVNEFDRVAGMTRALHKEPKVMAILADGKPEVTLTAKDPETGVPLKTRQDWMNPRRTLDLKSFTQMRGKSIDKSVNDAIYYERYWVQAYFYSLVRRLATGEERDASDFVFAFVESDQPHEVRLKRMLPKCGSEPNNYWLQARNEVNALIRQYAECLNKYGDKPWASEQQIDTVSDEDIRQFLWS